MRIACLLLVAGCHSPPPSPAAPTPVHVACEDTWLLLHTTYGCADKTNLSTGYRVLEVVDGAHRGKLVVAQYNPACHGSMTEWSLSNHVVFGVAAKVDNDCTRFVGPDCTTPINDGVVETWTAGGIDSYSDEAAARAARDERCKSQ